MDKFDALARVGRWFLRTERDSTAGRLNFLGMLAALAFVTFETVLSGLEAVVRIFKADYESGGADPLMAFLIYVGANLLCVAVIALADAATGRTRD